MQERGRGFEQQDVAHFQLDVTQFSAEPLVTASDRDHRGVVMGAKSPSRMVFPSSATTRADDRLDECPLPCGTSISSLIVTGGQPADLAQVDDALQCPHEDQDVIGPQIAHSVLPPR